MICPRCDGNQYAEINGEQKLCPKCGGRGQVGDHPRLDMMNDWMDRARRWQEHVIRFAVTVILVWSAWSFCAGLGEDSGSTSSGLLFAVLFSTVPAAWLWGREFQEARIRHESKTQHRGSTRWTAAASEPPSRTEVNQGEPWRVEQTRTRSVDSYGWDRPPDEANPDDDD